MSVTIDGIISGIDTTALLDSLTFAAGFQKTAMEAELADAQSTLNSIAGLSNALQALSDGITAMSTSGLGATASTVPLGAGFTATTTSDAPLGTYSVEVLALARADMESSQGFASSTAAGTIGQGTMTVTVGGVAVDVTIDGTNDSLDGLAATLDAVDGIRAYVVNTGEAGTPYKLVVLGETTGVANAVTFDTSGLTGTVPIFTQLQAATDAHTRINGLDVFTSTNQVDAVPGITLDLTVQGGPAVDLEVHRDDTAIEASIQSVVDLYNAVVDYYATNTVFNAELDLEGALVGESVARRVMDGLGSLVSTSTTVATSNFTVLAQLGIATTQDGHLTLDTVALQENLNSNYDDVIGLLTDAAGPLAQLQTAINDTYVDPDTGTLSSRSTSLEDQITDLGVSIAEETERLATLTETLRAQFTAMEIALAELQTTSSFLTAFFAPPPKE